MSSLWHPVGPAGARTYWRRRIVLLLLLVALITTAVVLLTRGGEPGPSAQAALQPSAAGTATTAPTGPPTTGPTTGSATASESAASTAEVEACSSDDLVLTVSTDAVTYGPGAKPRFGLKVQNSSETACTVEVGSALERFVVATAGGERVWSSEDCTLRGQTEVVELAPDEGHASAAVWQGGRSDAGCPTDLPRAGAGDYTVTASLGDLTAEPKSFAVS